MNNKNQAITKQPKNTAILPLAQEISQYRQAKLAGRKYIGPIINIAPLWAEIRSPLTTLDRNLNQEPTLIVYPKSVKLEAEIQPLNEEVNSLNQLLRGREDDLARVRTETLEQKKQLTRLENTKKSNFAIIKNLKQQLMNMSYNQSNQIEIKKLEEKLILKEKENQDLKRQIESLNQNLQAEEKLKKEILSYRQQIRELALHQKKLQQLVSREEKQLKKLEEKLAKKAKKPEEKQQLHKLEKMLEQAVTASITPPKPKKEIITVDQTKASPDLPILSQTPNVISGFVKDEKGKLISGAIVIIKDKTHRNLRALKSNQLGQFVVTSPLPNGQYFIQVEKKNFSFNLISINLVGEKLHPLEIVGHEFSS